MLGLLTRLVASVFRPPPPGPKLDRWYRVTLNLDKLRARMPAKGDSPVSSADANKWLMRIGCVPTAKPDVWKAVELVVGRLPKSAVVESERLA